MRAAGFRLGMGGILAALVTAGLVGGAATSVNANTDPTLSPVQFTVCGSYSWTVPGGVTSITAYVFGAVGGTGSALTGGTVSHGGGGAFVKATVPVTPGEVLQVNVGCAGGDADAHTPGAGGRGGDGDANGGDGAPGANVPVFTASGGGGGASDIRQGGTALSNRVIVAAGGGGGSDAGTSGTAAAGGNGGLPDGAAGGTSGGITPGCEGGQGGTQSAGGAGGGTDAQNCTLAGISATGAEGADGVSNGTSFASGGGGGGWFGGGSGATTTDDPGVTGGGGGGGGSSYVSASASGVASIAGGQKDSGLVIIAFDVAPAATPIVQAPMFTG